MKNLGKGEPERNNPRISTPLLQILQRIGRNEGSHRSWLVRG
jgi:hypothetical protein